MKWLTLVWLATAAAAEDQCDGPVLQLLLRGGKDAPPRTLYGVLATFGGVPLFNLSKPAQLVAANPLNACGELQPSEGAVYLVERGNCSFVDKYQAVVVAGGSGMVLYDDIPGCITMGGVINSTGNSSTPQPPPQHRNTSAPPGLSIPRSDGTQLLGELLLGSDLTIQWQLLDVPALDASALLLWLMAVATVVVGSLWCGSDYALELKGLGVGLTPEDGHRSGSSGIASGTNNNGGGGGGLEILEISMKGAVGFVVVSSAMLLLLYFFLNKVFFYIILGGFAAAGAQALAVMLLPVVCKALPTVACKSVTLPWGWGDIGVLELVVVPVAVAVSVVWAVFRNASWSWVLQDVLGIAIMLLVLRTLRLPNLRVACVLLPLCFVYDVFWVFLQPLITGSDTSVMVEVAGGGDSHEFLPMLLRVPRLSGPPIIRGAYSLLGFGDVILPGLLVALMRRVDILMTASSAAAASSSSSASGGGKRQGRCCRHSGYFVPTVMGYGGGLLLTYVALMFSWFGDQGQPALLYLVPCTLGVVLTMAVARGELHLLLDVALDPQDDAIDVDATDGDADGADDDDQAGSGGGLQGPGRNNTLHQQQQHGPRAAGSRSEKRHRAKAAAAGGGGSWRGVGDESGAEQRVALLGQQSSSSSGGGQQQQLSSLQGPGPVAEGIQEVQYDLLDSLTSPQQQQKQKQSRVSYETGCVNGGDGGVISSSQQGKQGFVGLST